MQVARFSVIAALAVSLGLSGCATNGTDGAAATAAAVPTSADNGAATGGSATTQVGGMITQGNLTGAEVSALSGVGINNLHLMPATIAAGQALTTGSNTWDPNWNPYVTPLPSTGTPITTSTARSTGDDGFALWSQGSTLTGISQSNSQDCGTEARGHRDMV